MPQVLCGRSGFQPEPSNPRGFVFSPMLGYLYGKCLGSPATGPGPGNTHSIHPLVDLRFAPISLPKALAFVAMDVSTSQDEKMLRFKKDRIAV